MNPLEEPLELALRRETMQRLLLELYEEKDWKGLLAAAEIMNTAWHQQAAMAKWFAKEAADNLAEAWQAGRANQRKPDGPSC